MAKLYKLTDVDGYTRNNTRWGKNVTHTTDGSGELCGPGWLHAYTCLLYTSYRPPPRWRVAG